MNCLEFRRQCLTEPNSGDAAFLEHMQHCRACAEFRTQQKHHEDSLHQAFAVAPPAGLEARILLRQSFARTARTRLAMVAGIAAVAIAALTWIWTTPATLEAEVLAHIRAEPEHLAATGPETPAKVASVLHALGVTLKGNPIDIRHAGICDIRRRPAVHLVLSGRLGPVTVLLLPGETVRERVTFERDALQGLLIPLDNGAAAIVGLPGEPLAPIEAFLPQGFTG